MAGRNQHHVPQQLMRGFAVSRGKIEGVFLYRPDKTRALPVNLEGANSMKDFYNDPEDTTLDESITRLESNEFGHVLHKARTGATLQEADEHSLRRFVAHLIARTRSTRTMATDLMERTFDAVETNLTDPGLFAEFIANNPDDVVEITKSAAASAFSDLAKQGIELTDERKAEAQAMLLQLMGQQPEAIGRELASAAKNAMASKPPPRADGAAIQRQVLTRNPIPAASFAEFEACALSIETVGDDLILGDDPVLAFSASGALQRTMLHDEEPFLYCLPLAPRVVLVLRREGEPVLPSVAALNRASAASSRHQFIAKDERDAFVALIPEIDTFRGEGESTDIAAMLREQVPKKD
jgi:hypothetical protein